MVNYRRVNSSQAVSEQTTARDDHMRRMVVPTHSQFKASRSFNDFGSSSCSALNPVSAATSSDGSQAAVTYSQYKLGDKQDLKASFVVMQIEKSPDLVSKITEAPSEEMKESPPQQDVEEPSE